MTSHPNYSSEIPDELTLNANDASQNGEQPKAVPRLRLEYRDPRSLRPHPKNWRKHGQRQRQAFSDVLDEVGMVDGVIYNERTGHLLDGHMRVEEFIERNESEIPVIIVDLPEDKENLTLYFKDRVGEMNGVESLIERELAALVSTESQLLAAIMAGVTEDAVIKDDEEKVEEDFRNIGLNPGEGFNYVMMIFRTDLDWYAAIEHFELAHVQDPLRSNKVGLGRIVDGGAYITKIRGG